jgi:hypothetical protein
MDKNGPDWFVGNVFNGARPWFPGPRGFYDHVDNALDLDFGYQGTVPERRSKPLNHFQPNEATDGTGNVGNARHQPSG